MRMWDYVEVGGAVTVAVGLWMYAPWVAVTFAGSVMLVVGMAKCLRRNQE